MLKLLDEGAGCAAWVGLRAGGRSRAHPRGPRRGDGGRAAHGGDAGARRAYRGGPPVNIRARPTHNSASTASWMAGSIESARWRGSSATRSAPGRSHPGSAERLARMRERVNAMVSVRDRLRQHTRDLTAEENRIRETRMRIGRAIDALGADEARVHRQIDKLATALGEARLARERAAASYPRRAPARSLHRRARPGRAADGRTRAIGVLVELGRAGGEAPRRGGRRGALRRGAGSGARDGGRSPFPAGAAPRTRGRAERRGRGGYHPGAPRAHRARARRSERISAR